MIIIIIVYSFFQWPKYPYYIGLNVLSGGFVIILWKQNDIIFAVEPQSPDTCKALNRVSPHAPSSLGVRSNSYSFKYTCIYLVHA